jgi:iron complex outermembrane recepter protein
MNTGSLGAKGCVLLGWLAVQAWVPGAIAQEARGPAEDEMFSQEGPWPGEDEGPRDDEEPEIVDVIPVPQPPAALPAAAPEGAVLDDMVVTAQKREQRIQDVPVSMSVIDEQFIKAQGITNVRELLLFVPNMKVETGSTLGGPRCRGFGLNLRNRSFEPPCGVAIDGVPYTASDYFDLAIFDIGRVEVLRGPQGTTFGKNTTAGVIHVITKNPSAGDEGLMGGVNVQVGDLNRRRGEAAIGQSFFGGAMNLRVAGMLEERDGYLRNTTADVVPGAVRTPLSGDRDGVRVKLAFPDLFGSRFLFGYESSRSRVAGFGGEASDVSADMADYMRQFDPDADFERGNFVVSTDTPEHLDIGIETFQMDWTHFIGGWTINAVAAQSTLERQAEADADYFPAPAIRGIQNDVNPTTSVELRGIPGTFQGLYGLDTLWGWDLGRSELLTGVFYQERRIDDGLLFLEGHGQILLDMIAIDSGFPPSPVPPGVPEKESIHTIFEQTAETLAAFAELQWYFADAWMLQYGMRLSKEDKAATWDQTMSDPHPVLTAAGWAPFTAQKERSETQFLPKVALNYKPFDGISLFARWTRGFKGGGFNSFSQTGESSSLSSLTFEPETATEWAFDAKMELFAGRAHVNLSAFRLDIVDFQTLIQVDDPVTGFPAGNTVVNVGQARAQGIEGDITYLPADWLRIIATVGLNDTEFIEFPFNSCPQGEVDTDGDGDPRCDASGRPFPFAPRWNNTLTLMAHAPVADLFGFALGGLELRAGMTVEHVSSQFLNVDLNPASEQPEYLRYRANAGFGNPAQGWSFSVIGENLTDEITSQRQDDISWVVGSYPEPRRTFYSQFQLTF